MKPSKNEGKNHGVSGNISQPTSIHRQLQLWLCWLGHLRSDPDPDKLGFVGDQDVGRLLKIAMISMGNVWGSPKSWRYPQIIQDIQVIRPWLRIETYGDLGIPHFQNPQEKLLRRYEASNFAHHFQTNPYGARGTSIYVWFLVFFERLPWEVRMNPAMAFLNIIGWCRCPASARFYRAFQKGTIYADMSHGEKIACIPVLGDTHQSIDRNLYGFPVWLSIGYPLVYKWYIFPVFYMDNHSLPTTYIDPGTRWLLYQIAGSTDVHPGVSVHVVKRLVNTIRIIPKWSLYWVYRTVYPVRNGRWCLTNHPVRRMVFWTLLDGLSLAPENGTARMTTALSLWCHRDQLV